MLFVYLDFTSVFYVCFLFISKELYEPGQKRIFHWEHLVLFISKELYEPGQKGIFHWEHLDIISLLI